MLPPRGLRYALPLALALVALYAAVGQAASSTFTVTTTADTGAGSLRQAILDANANSGADTIEFNIPGAGPYTISPTSGLPTITGPVTIDGTTQPGFSAITGNPVIELNGSSAGASADGLRITAGSSTVKALAINRFGGQGIELQANGANSILGNYVGTDPAGTTARPNGLGLYVSSGTGNVVGGTSAAERNVISGNSAGVRFDSTGNQLRGNYIGVAAGGSGALPNSDGVVLLEGGNTIGGSGAGEGNVISGNTQAGVNLAASAATANTVQGNLIGVAADGTTARGNDSGILIQLGTAPSQIGGTSAAARNVISSNRDGIVMNAPATAAVIEGNYIGVAANGTDARPNTRWGIDLNGAQGNRVGGTAAGAGNLIANSGQEGVLVSAGNGNAILGNSVSANGALGIDLGGGGVTANDASDGDSGANNLQNFPVLTGATSGGGETEVAGTLNSEASKTYRLEFFSSPSCDASGKGEGKTFLGAANEATDAGGDVSFSATLTTEATVGDQVTATATDPDGNTSEFSSCQAVAAAPPETTEFASLGCIDDNDVLLGQGPDACAQSTDGLEGAASVALSPDHKSVYVTSQPEDAITIFDRDLDTGALTPVGCVEDDDLGADDCGQTSEGLQNVNAVAVSPDGEYAYAVSSADRAIVSFDRNPSTGALTPMSCVEGWSLGPDSCQERVPGMENGANAIAISPDGESLYAASPIDRSIVGFKRNPATGELIIDVQPSGALTPICVSDQGTSPVGCSQTSPGLGGPTSIAFSPDGESLYAATVFDSTVVRFDRDPQSGALTPQGCVEDNDTGSGECTQTTDGLGGALSVATSGDGESVYAGSQVDSAVVSFERSPGGALSPVGCVDDEDAGQGTDDCGDTASALNGARGVAVSPGGASVYVAASEDDAVTRLNRNPQGGALSPGSCIDDNDTGADDCTESANGLDGAGAVAVAPGGHAYAVSFWDDALSHFGPAPEDSAPPETTIDSGPSGSTTDSTPTFTFSSDEPGSSFECRVDTDPFGPCSGPGDSHTTASLPDGPHTFEVRAIDPAGNTDPTPPGQSFTVATLNTPPTATNQAVTTPEDSVKTITLGGADADGDPLTFKITNLPGHGTLYDGAGTGGHRITLGELPYAVQDPARRVTYVPAANYNGVDNFKFLTNDGTTDSALATVGIGVTPVNDVPAVTGETLSTIQEAEGVWDDVAYFSDPDPQPMTDYTARINWGDGTSSLGTIYEGYGPREYGVFGDHSYKRFGTYNVTVTVVDARGGSGSVTTTIKVTDASIAAGDTTGGWATAGKKWGPYPVFCVEDYNPYGVASDLSATIKWGDGTSSAGTIKRASSADQCGRLGWDFGVWGSHTWAKAGKYTLTYIVTSVGGSKDTATGRGFEVRP